MSIKLKLTKHFRVFLVRKPLIGSALSGGGAGGSGSFKPPSGPQHLGGGHLALYGVSTEEIGIAINPEDALCRDGFVHVYKPENEGHEIFASLKDVHSVEFIPVYDETSL